MLAGILSSARRNNPRDGITGALICRDDLFLQLLEGPEAAVEALIAAYRRGLFPMPISRRDIGWFSPDPRGIIPLDGLHVTRSLRQSAKPRAAASSA